MRSALIVPCNLCPAVTVSVREKRPFIQLFKSFLKSTPYEQHIRSLQNRLKEKGLKTEVFESNLMHQWFLCMWTSGRRKKLRKAAQNHEAVVVLGCQSATETVRDAINSADCKVIEGMEVAGIMNAKLRIQLPCDVSFEDASIVPISAQKKK
jgi:hypothetical protein